MVVGASEPARSSAAAVGGRSKAVFRAGSNVDWLVGAANALDGGTLVVSALVVWALLLGLGLPTGVPRTGVATARNLA